MLADDGRTVVVHRCENAGAHESPPSLGPCSAAEVALDDVADPSAYREWSGSAFDVPVGEGAPMVMPGDDLTAHPPGGFTVARDPGVDAYVMAYSPWPGRSTHLVLRFGSTAAGPWSAPVAVRLPGCDDRIAQRRFHCYAATVQPIFSEPSRLGVGWYDSRINRTLDVRGAYTVGQVDIRHAGTVHRPFGTHVPPTASVVPDSRR